jgi:DNA-binding transcriptional LysR family regulator
MKQYPDVKLEVKEGAMDTLLADLSHHELDLVITYAPLYPIENVISTELFNNQLAVVMRDTHPLAKQKSVSLKNDLSHYHVIVPDISMQARYVTERLIAKLGLKVKVSVSSNSITNVLDLVAASDMVSFLSTSIVMNRKGVVSRPIAEESPIMKACYHTRKDSLIKYAVKEFIRVLNETQFVRQAQQEKKK